MSKNKLIDEHFQPQVMQPLSHKSVESMAARVDLLNTSARHQALHHFVAKFEWTETAIVAWESNWVVPVHGLSSCCWIIDNTDALKKVKHSMGRNSEVSGNDYH